jgi:VIT1/CCC1 family predicted Fe2+/Mn2+ transporter
MISRRVEKALAAYDKKDISASQKAHTKEQIEKDLHGQSFGGKYVGEFVYGALDGTITTFAVVAAVAGASLQPGIALILGLANLFGDGFSMATGNYLSSKSEKEYFEQEKKREEWEIEHVRKGEVEEIRQIYMRKGFKGKALEHAIETITSDKKIWVDTMLKEELNLNEPDNEPIKNAAATFISFIVVGFIPLVSFVISYFLPATRPYVFTMSIILTGTALFTVGAAKTIVTKRNWFRNGVEMLLVGGLAALVAYLVGFFLKGFGI